MNTTHDVGIVMGSDSDLPVMKAAAEILQEFKISHNVQIVSAHRTPDFLHEYASSVEANGYKVIIAGAGGSAHLPGMIASLTSLPVIGVPIKTSTAEGIDSLFSIVQMPPGVPVATVSINGAKNAGILAAQILGISDEATQKNVSSFKKNMRDVVLEKSKTLSEQGFRDYLESNDML